MTEQAQEQDAAAQPDSITLVRAQLQAWAQQAIALRRVVADGFPRAGAPGQVFFEALVTTRGALDQAEEILRTASSYRRAARRWAQDADFEESDTFDRISAQMRRSGRGVGDYTTGRERQADISLQMLPAVRENRTRKRLEDECEELLEAIRIVHRGMDSTRQDLVAVLRYLQFESNLER